jgi:inosine-uridine nucleoside N-ribohydrolase
LGGSEGMSPSRTPVIIDTDPGVDDALAMSFFMFRPNEQHLLMK